MRKNPNLESVRFDGISWDKGDRHTFLLDFSTDIMRWSKSAVDYFGLDSEFMHNAGEIWANYIHENDKEVFLQDIGEVFSGCKKEHDLIYRVRNKHGEYVTVRCRGKVVQAISGDCQVFVGAVENLNVSNMVNTITGLHNMNAFLKDIPNYINSGDKVAFIIIGLTQFHDINNRFGYESGNKILKRVGDYLISINEHIDKVYCLDGVRFCIPVSYSGSRQLKRIFYSIKEYLRKGIEIEQSKMYVNVAGGALVVSDWNMDSRILVMILYHILSDSKYKLHNEFNFSHSNNIDDGIRNLRILGHIRQSIFDNMKGFYLLHQPLVDVGNNSVYGMESLIRWQDDEYGNIMPGQFIDWLELDPSFYDLGLWILETSMQSGKEILKLCPSFVLNINLSAEQLKKAHFKHDLAVILERTGFPGANLCLELTERVLTMDLDVLRKELLDIKSLGVKIALDDFGTKESSLQLLLKLPADVLKIDREFIKELCSSEAQQAIVTAIVILADKFNMEICAEGVETKEIKSKLEEYGIIHHQGFLYGRPVSLEEISGLLINKSIYIA